MPDVLGFGENSIDYVYRVASLPAVGQKLRVADRSITPGGQVATTMAACASLGLTSSYVGTFGSDDGGTAVRTALHDRGVDLRHALTREAPNRYALILVDESGERVILWNRDPRLAVAPEQVRAEWAHAARVVHVDATDERASIQLAGVARSRNAIVTCDVDAVTPLTVDLLNVATDPVLAENVPVQLTGEADCERALRLLRNRHPGRLVVTLGARGALMLEGETLVHEPGFSLTVVDTTGAGDVFRAGFICGLLRGLSGRALLRYANAAAALSCTRPGAISSVPSVSEVDRLFRSG